MTRSFAPFFYLDKNAKYCSFFCRVRSLAMHPSRGDWAALPEFHPRHGLGTFAADNAATPNFYHYM
jgi:hypothetical protein